jgi:hypothetical protein
VASRRRAVGGPHLDGGKRNGEGEGISGQMSPFIGEGERERGSVLVLLVGDSRPMPHRSGGDVTCVGLPCSRSLTNGPQPVFLKLARVRFAPGLHCSWARPTKN